MRKFKNLKKWGWLPILLLMIGVASIITVALVTESAEESLFNLNEREIVLEMNESRKVELESEKVNIKKAKMTVSWRRSKPLVAAVDDD